MGNQQQTFVQAATPNWTTKKASLAETLSWETRSVVVCFNRTVKNLSSYSLSNSRAPVGLLSVSLSSVSVTTSNVLL
jgi:hypothetical protein